MGKFPLITRQILSINDIIDGEPRQKNVIKDLFITEIISSLILIMDSLWLINLNQRLINVKRHYTKEKGYYFLAKQVTQNH